MNKEYDATKLNKPIKVFISGKITEDPDYKEKFAKKEQVIRELGYVPLNPAVLPQGMKISSYMEISFIMIEEADIILMLSDWKKSKGAKVEYEYAKYLNKHIAFEY